ncbi:hypothetical protein BAUCODRAFT_144696 [Baudoinia panamericana UAMH 10762]|uniref:Mid2 domain-containing protein n=1 Tax=Baudoinia panamericana (strain UAMH 10762) TaxID=717646 RepID=M2NA87_BAUPA|nr:uncharacterized protein BAUCODRAFT_144696 [Baudoinia panamericana UAMH 10762]EMD01134.1 hypothetical protein BAUCODRAFT_144696 [Baudoinia panamericana UAMH 10762]
MGGNGGQSTVTSYATVAGAGQQPTSHGTATSSSSSSTSSAGLMGGNGNDNQNTPPAGTIAGGVVGGAAGLAMVLLIAMLFLRWYRRKSQRGQTALPAGADFSSDFGHGRSRGPGMAERAGLMPALGAVPALFRHQNRNSAVSSEPTERGFQRVSGRKLPSSFSPGMTAAEGAGGAAAAMPLAEHERNLSGNSYFHNSGGSLGAAAGGAGPFSDAAAIHDNDRDEQMTLSPGPQRRPTVHAGGPYNMSSPPTTASSTLAPATTPKSPRMDRPTSPQGTVGTSATFDRSETPSSLDWNRGSKFTEEV